MNNIYLLHGFAQTLYENVNQNQQDNIFKSQYVAVWQEVGPYILLLGFAALFSGLVTRKLLKGLVKKPVQGPVSRATGLSKETRNVIISVVVVAIVGGTVLLFSPSGPFAVILAVALGTICGTLLGWGGHIDKYAKKTYTK